jgi:hypothetical protein
VSRARTFLISAFALGFSLLAMGCTPALEGLTVTELTTPPGTTNVGNARMAITEGTGVGLKILAFTKDPNMRDSDGNLPDPVDPSHVKVTSDNESIAKVFHVEGGIYIVTATGPGNVNLIVNSTDTNGYIQYGVQVVAQ